MQSHLNIEVKNSPSEAPNYNKEIDIRRIVICKVIVVGKGTESGKATVDFQMVTEDGARFVAMLTGALVRQLVSVIDGVESR